MRSTAAFVLLTVAGLITGCDKTSPATKSDPEGGTDDKALAQGTWAVEKIDILPADAAPPEAELKKLSVTIKDTLATLVTEGKSNRQEHVVLTIDSSKSPKWVDLTESNERAETGPKRTQVSAKEFREVPPEKMLGIYKFEADNLVVALAPPGLPRPTEFKPAGPKPGGPPRDAGAVVVVYLKKK